MEHVDGIDMDDLVHFRHELKKALEGINDNTN